MKNSHSKKKLFVTSSVTQFNYKAIGIFCIITVLLLFLYNKFHLSDINTVAKTQFLIQVVCYPIVLFRLILNISYALQVKSIISANRTDWKFNLFRKRIKILYVPFIVMASCEELLFRYLVPSFLYTILVHLNVQSLISVILSILLSNVFDTLLHYDFEFEKIVEHFVLSFGFTGFYMLGGFVFATTMHFIYNIFIELYKRQEMYKQVFEEYL